MADVSNVSINALPEATAVSDNGLLVIYQNNATQSVTGQLVKNYAATAATEIASPIAATAVENKFEGMAVNASTLPAGSQATATYNADTNTLSMGIPKGADGSGAGDMTKAEYDSSGAVANAGGIADYVAANAGGALIVNITNNSGTSTADKTFDEIKAAYNAGKLVTAKDGSANEIYYLSDISNSAIVFTNAVSGNAPSEGIRISSSNSVGGYTITPLGRFTSIDSADMAYGTPMARAIYAGTESMTAGASALVSGAIYLQYE